MGKDEAGTCCPGVYRKAVDAAQLYQALAIDGAKRLDLDEL